MASVLSSSPLSMTLSAAAPWIQPRQLNAMSVSMVNGLRLPRSIQLKGVTKSSLPFSRRFKSKISCSVAQPETLEIVQNTIAKQLSIDETTVTPHTKFADLGADSLDTVEIMMALEEEFGVSIGEGGAENVSTVQDAVDLIEKVKAEAA
ncbi:uncharacterized protein A4U43_C06F3650 [Asparagus officinalis]|uniref:Acyl carrier protein n=1 Tax=Asparagus officinalis TaxID=4686 RepID=A0A5P1EPT4_ASPOF|nr:uncharacterized protein LOC109844826 [Asparagus officinalis]ONK66050.1 uncharacterized protein A4U43_C06F3650 [Asparagus officinalis]